MILSDLEIKLTEAIEFALSRDRGLIKYEWIQFRDGNKILPGFSIAGVMLFSSSDSFSNNWNIPNPLSWFYHVSKKYHITSNELQALESGWAGKCMGWFSNNPECLEMFSEYVELGAKLAKKYSDKFIKENEKFK